MTFLRASTVKVGIAALLGWGVVTADPAGTPNVPSAAFQPRGAAKAANALAAKRDSKRGPTFTVTTGAAGQPAPVTATLRDAVTGDVNANGQADPGDTLTYTATIAANGTDATGVNFTAALDPNTTLIPGSVRATPVSVNDSYFTTQNTPLTRPAGTGVLANDFLGFPVSTVTAFQTPTPHGGTVLVVSDGGFTYTPATGYSGPDTFTYTITNPSGSSTATVTVDVFTAPVAVDDTYGVTKGLSLNVPAPGILGNDTGTPAPTLTAFTGATSQGGSVILNADGSFSYAPPSLAFVSPPEDTFSYTITNVAGSTSGTVHLFVDAPPAVVTRAPVAGAANVATDTNISLTFNEPVTVTGSAFALACPSGTPVPFTNTTGAGPATTFVLDPTPSLPTGVTCTVTTVGAEISDTDANDPPDHALANDVFTFTVDAPPAVATTIPANGATGVALNANLIVSFNEPVNVNAANWFQIVCSQSGTRNPADTNVTGSTTTFAIDPTFDFLPGDSCTATIFAALVSDLDAGDPPDTMTADYVFTFAMDPAPAVATSLPANGAANIATNTNVSITFSEDVNATGASFTISCGTSGTHTFALSGGPLTWVLDPDADFTPGETCNVTVVSAQISDQDANDPPDHMLGDDVISFTLEQAPSVVTTLPANGAANVATNANLTITFSEAVTITNASVTLTCDASGAHTVVVSGGPTVWTADPVVDFTQGEACTATVLANAVSDQDSVDPPDHMLADSVFLFTVDVAPSVSATTPANGATDQTTTTDLTVTFSEPVTVSGSWFTIACTVSGSHTATVTGGATAWTLNPDTNFTQGETCTVTIAAAQVSDNDAGDPPDTLASDYVFSFTIDETPRVVSTVPANGATGVALDANLTVTFSEPVNVNTVTGWFHIACGASGLRFITDTVVSTSDNVTFTINPNTNFAAGESCSPQVFSNRVSDQDANDPPDQMLNPNHIWTFSTDAAPAVMATTPANNAVSILSNANIDITFSEPVNAGAGSFTLSCSSSGAHSFVLSGGSTTFTLNPDADFTPGETCTTTVLAVNVTDVDANDPPDNMLADHVFSFTIEAAPFVASSQPADAGVQGTNQNFTITFSEPVTVAGNWFSIACPSRTQNVADTNVTTSDNTTFTIDPNDDFVVGEGPCTLTVFAAQVADQDTNDPPDTMVTNAVITFSIDVPPAVQTTDPANGASNAGPAQNITITFTEPVDVSGTWFSISCTSTGSHTASVSGGPTVFTLDPDADFAAPENCTVTVFGAAVADQDTGDPPDTMTGDYSFSFATDAAPGVQSTTPPNGSVDVPGIANVTITFSEAVNVTGTWFQIACPTSGTRTPANTNVSPVSGPATTFTLNPNVDFASAETCTATVFASQVTDADANDPPDNMAADYTFGFTIDAAPQVTTTVPANGAVDQAGNSTITINFTEPVNVAAGGVTIGCPAAVPFTPALPQGPVTSLVLTPSTPLPGGATCTVTVVAANIHDVDTNDPPDLLDGNGDGTPGDNYAFSFTVDAAPRVTLPTSPANGAANQATNINLTINFSEAVDLAVGSVTLGCPAAVPFNSTPALPATGATSIVLDPTSDLPTGALCTVTVVAANVTDSDTADPPDQLDGNGDNVPGDNHVFSFTTDAAPRVNVPTTPPNGATNVPAATNITITFSELVNVAAGGITIECPVGTPVAFTPALPQANISSIVLDPTTNLPGNTTCTVAVVATGVTDVDANDPPDQLDGNGDGVPGDNHVFSFTTASTAEDDSYNVSPHLTLTIPAGTGVKANDNPNTVTITGFGPTLATANGTVPNGTNTVTTTLGTGGVVTLNADGSFTYIPPPDTVNATDHFFYTITGGDTADVSLVIQNQTVIWFVDASYAGANGTSNGTQGRPFTLLTGAGSFDASALPDNNTNDWVFIKQGSYTCGLSMVNTQKIVGDGSSSDLATITGVTPVTGSSFPAFTGTDPTLSVGGTGNCLAVGTGNTIRGVALNATAGGATAVSGTAVGTLTMLEVTIDGVGGAFAITTSGTLAVTLNRLRSTGSTGSVIALTGVGGTMTVNGPGPVTDIHGAAGADISIAGGSLSMTFNGTITQANNAPLLNVTGGHTGTLTFQAGPISATNGTGLQFANADGTYNFNSTTTLNGGDAGVDILDDSSGIFTFGTLTAITSPTGIALNVNGQALTSTAAVTYNGNITQATAAQAMVSVSNHSTGTISFQTGTLSATNGTGLQFVNADGTYNFNTSSGTTTLNGGDAGIDITVGSSGTFNFGRTASPTNFAITSPTGTAFLVSTGAPSVTYSGTITQNNAQRMIAVGDTTGGGVVFNSPNANSYVSGGTGILIDGAAGSVTVNNGDLNGTRGIEILGDATNNATGTFTFNNVTIDTTAGAGNHAFIVDGDQGTTTNNDVAAVIDLNNVDITNPGGLVASIQGMAGGSIDFDSASAISRTNGGQGFSATSNAGGTVTVNSATKTFNTGTNNAISLTSNPGTTFNFVGGNLDIDTTSGAGFTATGGGTVTVQGTVNTILANGSGTALNIANTTIGAADVTFQSISAGTGSGSAGTGIIVDTTGTSGGLHITGTGSVASGGTIQHKTGADNTTSGIGIFLNSTSEVQLNWMQLNNFDNFGIRGTSVDGFTLNNSVIDAGVAGNTNGNTTAFDEASVSFGIAAPSTTNGITGTASITNTTIADGYEDNLSVFNHSGSLTLTLDNLVVRDTGGGLAAGPNQGNDGVLIKANATATVSVDMRNSDLIANRGDHFNATADDAANLTVHFGDNGANTLVGGNPDPLGQDVVIQAGLAWSGTGSAFVSNNTINNAKDTPININIGGTGTFGATVTNNVIGTSGVSGSGTTGNKDAIRIVANGDAAVDPTPNGGTFNALVNGNTIQQVSGRGIFAIARDGGTAGDPIELNLTIQGNILRQSPNSGGQAIRVESGATSSDDVRVHANIGGVGTERNDLQDDWGTNLPAGIDFDEIRITHNFSGASQFILTGLGVNTSSPATVNTYMTGRNLFTCSGVPANCVASSTIAGGGVYETGGPPPSPLFVASTVDAAGAAPVASVNDAALRALLPYATARYAGVEAAAVRGDLTVRAADLSTRKLAENSSDVLNLDRTAAGWGWFVDPTPDRDEEFGPPSPTTGERVAKPAGPAAGKVDLLTALMHEIAHARGDADLDPIAHAGELMAATLPVGVRRGPLPLLASRSMNAALVPIAFSGETVTVNVATLPAGKSVVITYQATINANPITGPGFSLAHHGTVSGGNFAMIVTDDPDTGTPDDPTVTAMVCPTITVAPPDVPLALLGSVYGPVTFTASGGNGTTTLAQTGTLPSGLTFTPATATLSGTPTQAGSFAFTITATDENGCAGTTSYTLTVGGGRTVITGAGETGGPHVRRFTAIDGTTPAGGALESFFAFDPSFTGGVRVAEGDINGDGEPDYIAGAGPGGVPEVRVFDGASGTLIRSFLAFEPEFGGGVYVAAGDVDGNGFADIVVGSGPGRSGQLKVFSGIDNAVLRDTFVFPAAFTGGVRVAAGDVNGDGRAELLVGSGPGMNAQVSVLDAATGAALRTLQPYGAFPLGVFVAAGDVTGDGYADIVTGADSGGGPHVLVFNGVTGTAVMSFFAFDPAFTGGVRVAVGDVNGDRHADVIAGSGPGMRATVRVFDGVTGAIMSEVEPYGAYANSLFVATRAPLNRMALDVPAVGSTLSGAFSVGGWALMEDPANTGVSAIHVWAVPVTGGAPTFLGLATLGDTRPDVAALFGAQYLHAGYNLIAPALPPGVYDIAVAAQSSVTGTFQMMRVVRITVTP